MKPLREQQDDPDAVIRAGAALLAKVPPLELSAAQRRRIRARLDAMDEPPRRWRWMRPAVAVPVLLIVGVAGATVGPTLYRAVAPPPSPPRAASQAAATDPQARPAVAPRAAPTSVDGPAPAAVASAISQQSRQAEKPAPAPPPSPSGPGAALMMEALQARRAGDSARAQRLTAEYQRKYPRGALKEEALAIAFESAAARKDPSAPQLARRYLTAFPKGRFRAQAEQVLSSP